MKKRREERIRRERGAGGRNLEREHRKRGRDTEKGRERREGMRAREMKSQRKQKKITGRKKKS